MRREVTDSKGLLIFELGWDRSYEFQAIKKGYLNQYRAFSTMDIKKDRSNPVTTYNMEIVLEPIFENTEIVLHDIFYDYDEWAIRDDARPSLDALAKILKENPNLRIQLSSHTDCRGEDDYNQDLSQKRAQSAVDYLVSQQIQSDRMTAVGYGESRLAVNCNCTDCTEDQHQQNRRTTFKILGNR
jgi:outer membrane protein OmpA-like peptidoglycan-associated protein